MTHSIGPIVEVSYDLVICHLVMLTYGSGILRRLKQSTCHIFGFQVMALLNMTKPGPEMGLATAAVMEWQLAHPGGTVEKCKEFIASKYLKS